MGEGEREELHHTVMHLLRIVCFGTELLGSCLRYRTPPSQYWILSASRASPSSRKAPSVEGLAPDTGSPAVQTRCT